MKYPFRYLLRLRYLGFRYHGWAKQPGWKTVHGMVDKTTAFVLGHQQFKTMGCSRTDAMVSALDYGCELMLNEPVPAHHLLAGYDHHLPPDIDPISVTPITRNDFNILTSVRAKEYDYHYVFGDRAHPFHAPFAARFEGIPDIGRMQEAARLFEGEHWLGNYCTQPSEHARLQRRIFRSRVTRADPGDSGWFPEGTLLYRIRSEGFLRHQVRLIAGRLADVAFGKTTPQQVLESLRKGSDFPCTTIAPASGLVLRKIEFEPLHDEPGIH